MSNGVFARLISKLRPSNNTVVDDLRDEPSTAEIDDRHDKYLFADMLSASTALDFGGVPADFFQMHSRDFIESGVAGKAEPK